MTISASDWSATADPYIMASEMIVGANVSSYHFAAPNRSGRRFYIKGPVNVIVDDPDVQEVVLVKDSSGERATAHSFGLLTGGGAIDHETEFSDFTIGQEDNEVVFEVIDFLGANDETGSVCDVSMLDNGGPSYTQVWSIHIYTGYCWEQKTLPQIIFSHLTFYAESDNFLRDFLDEDSFTASSYWLHSEGAGISNAESAAYRMDVMREVGKTFGDQINSLLSQTHDWCAIRPNETDGVVSLHYLTRKKCVERDTAIDLDDTTASGVSSWSGGPVEKYVIDQHDFSYGNLVRRRKEGELGEFQGSLDFPIDHPREEDSITFKRRLDVVQTVKHNLRNVNHRGAIYRYWHPYWWAHTQEDITFTQGAQHFNFEVGDIIHIKLAQLGLVGTEDFVVTDKELDLDSLSATVRVLRVYGFKGKLPWEIYDFTLKNDVHWYGTDTLGRQTEDLDILYANGSNLPRSAMDERWESRAEFPIFAGPASPNTSALAREAALGTPELKAGTLDDWPMLFTVGGQLAGDQKAGDWQLFLTGEFTLMIVMQPTGTASNFRAILDGVTSGAAQSTKIYGEGDTVGTLQFQEAGGSWEGTGFRTTNWQVVTFRLDKTDLADIFRDGVALDTDLTYAGTGASDDIELISVFGIRGGGSNAEINVTELILISGAISDSDHLAILTMLREKYPSLPTP
jgi:hypothetical protein